MDHLGGGEAALELVRCQENLHDLVSSSSAVTAAGVRVGDGWCREKAAGGPGHGPPAVV
jgi:hypothetical protein